MGSTAKQSGRPHGSDGKGASGISKNKISKIRKNTAMMSGEGEVGGVGWGVERSRQRARAGEGLVVGVPRARRPLVEAGGRSAATQDSNCRLKTAAPSSLKLGKAGAGSQWSSREEIDSDGVGGHCSARGRELLRRIHAITRSLKPAASAPCSNPKIETLLS